LKFFCFHVPRTTYVDIDVQDYYSKKFKVNTIINVKFVNLKRLLELDKIFQMLKIFQIFNSASLTNETNYDEESMEQNGDNQDRKKLKQSISTVDSVILLTIFYFYKKMSQ
jgi:hypothetical protein